jgi:hypothetical protein
MSDKRELRVGTAESYELSPAAQLFALASELETLEAIHRTSKMAINGRFIFIAKHIVERFSVGYGVLVPSMLCHHLPSDYNRSRDIGFGDLDREKGNPSERSPQLASLHNLASTGSPARY